VVEISVLFRTGRHDAVYIEQMLVALIQHVQRTAAFVRQPGASISQGISTELTGNLQSMAHSLAGFAIPVTRGHEACELPDNFFPFVGTRSVAAGHEGALPVSDTAERALDTARVSNRGGVTLWTNDDEIVIHELAPVDRVVGIDQRDFE